MTSSIESSFGSRQFTNGFLLNNQLTDFNFQPLKNEKKVKNRVQGGKKPLSSMSPLIILDKKIIFFFLSALLEELQLFPMYLNR